MHRSMQVGLERIDCRGAAGCKRRKMFDYLIIYLHHFSAEKLSFHKFHFQLINQLTAEPLCSESSGRKMSFNWLIDMRSSGVPSWNNRRHRPEVKRVNCGNDTNNRRLSNRYLDFLHLITPPINSLDLHFALAQEV